MKIMSEYIPLEIQEEILKRLPLRPLISCRSVSKPWKRLIDSPDFIISYGVRHPQPHGFIVRYSVTYDPDDVRYLNLVDSNNDDSFAKQPFLPPIPDLFKIYKYDPTVVGSCNGLLCFIGHNEYPDEDSSCVEMALLWNPSAKKSVGVQVPSMYNNKDFDNFDVVIGFGVCPLTCDPTIIKCCKKKIKNMFSITVPWRVRVFTLSTRTWSILSTKRPRNSVKLEWPQVVIDRFIYWVASDMLVTKHGRSQSPFLIMSFDLTTKAFKEINLTDSLTNPSCTIQTISKLHESLVLLECHREVEEVCCLWMMKEQGVNRSFTKLYNINVPHASIVTLLGFRRTGEIILATKSQQGYEAKLEMYDPNSEVIDDLRINGDHDSFFMCSYMDSLLLVDQINEFVY
uniref:F-box protein CPR1-like n=1 Tax=Erigeron canadensis TaxID=72917 RepID=UPI001CB91196|nr:F-box protein CPR1-like [Erigeron canadensis]XP_043629384.1 F-box protein CPR1-like [Erigeron canadensis]